MTSEENSLKCFDCHTPRSHLNISLWHPEAGQTLGHGKLRLGEATRTRRSGDLQNKRCDMGECIKTLEASMEKE